MDKSRPSATFIDLTEGDDEGTSVSRPPPNPTPTSRQNPAKAASRPNVEPLVLDLTNDVEAIAGAKHNAKANGSPEAAPLSGGYVFLNRPRPNRPENNLATSGGATNSPARKGVDNTQPFGARSNSHRVLDRATVRENWQEYRKSNPTPFASSRKQSKIPRIWAPNQAATSTPVPRPDPASVTPQKRKQPSSGHTPERPVFKSPPTTTWKDAGMPKSVSSSTARIGSNPQVHPALVERPKTLSQSPPRSSSSNTSAIMPRSRIFKSISEMMPSKEDKTSTGSSSLSPPRDSPVLEPNSMVDGPSSGVRNLHQQPEIQEEVAQDVAPDLSVSPTSSSFPPNFDRGRFPQERRRRGGLGLQNPYRHSKILPRHGRIGRSESRDSGANRPPAMRNSFGAGESRDNLGSQGRLLAPKPSLEADDLYSQWSYEALRLRLSGADARNGSRLGDGAAFKEQSLRDGPTQPLKRQDCDRCLRHGHMCDHRRPKCARCQRLKLGCRYNEKVQMQFELEQPAVKEHTGQKPLEQKRSLPITTSRNSLQTPNTRQTPGFANANISEQNQSLPLTVLNSASSTVRLKKEDSDENDPNSIPDYLDETRPTRGWHHDGYADVKDLFYRVAIDAVRKKREEFEEWPLELEATTTKVIKKAEGLAKQKFGYFVNRLKMSDGAVPNTNDVEWIQRKVSETFLAEAMRATSNVKESPPGSAQTEGIISPASPSTPDQLPGEKKPSEFEFRHTRSRASMPFEHIDSAPDSRTSSLSDLLGQESGGRKTSESEIHSTRSRGPSTSQHVNPTSVSRTSSPLSNMSSNEYIPLELHQRSTEPMVKSRPSRRAAGTAASRITSQYTIYGKPSGLERNRTGIVHDRRLCRDCDVWISVRNWGVHTSNKKHRENAGRTEPSKQAEVRLEDPKKEKAVWEKREDVTQYQRLCRYCDVWISVHNLGVHERTLKHRDNLSIQRSRDVAGQTESKAKAEVMTEDSQTDDAAQRKTEDAKQNLRHCMLCDVWILVKNWNIHLATQKHWDNLTLQKDRDIAGRTESKAEAETVLEESRQTHAAQEETEYPEQLPARLRFPLDDHSDKILKTQKLQPQSKVLQGSHLQSLAASIAILKRNVLRPYQGKLKRGTIDKDARIELLSKHSVLRHVGFASNEMAMIRMALVRDKSGVVDVTESMAKGYGSGIFREKERGWLAIKSRVQVLEENLQNDSPTFDMIESCVKDPNARPARHIGSLLRHRELGSSAVGRNVETRSELKTRLSEAIKPWRSFKGASHDVVTVAWAPNSMDFAAGAAAHSNSEDLQYNRPCNLLLGDLFRNTLTELPDHCVDRQKLKEGLNSSQDMFNACDPKVYKTVFSVKFHPSGDQMYSASEDQTVKIWNLSKSNPRCIRTIKHDAPVTLLDLSPVHAGYLATASRNVNNSIQVFKDSRGEEPLARLSSTRALLKPEWHIYPESLFWGPSAASGHLLLAGFNAWGQEGETTTEGHLCLWDANTGQDLKPMPGSQAIHTTTWHPELPYFATGGAAGFDRRNKLTTKTVVRAWDYRYSKRLAIEYECPSREMTDVTFHPLDHNIATAGCVESISYVWDFRWPDQPLHQLDHGKSIMTTGERDTGVMMSLWGTGNSLYYTGSSDGEIRAWDIRRHPNDVLVHTVARLGAGIQSGAFSPDGTHLLIGDATGGIRVLSSAPWEPGPHASADDDIGTESTPMTITRASDHGDENPGTLGIETARELVRSAKISLDPVYGPGKGPRYAGPWAAEHREPSSSNPNGKLKTAVDGQQAFSNSGEERPEFAAPIRKLAAARKELLDSPHRHDSEIPRPTPEASAPPQHLTTTSSNSNHSLLSAPTALTSSPKHPTITTPITSRVRDWYAEKLGTTTAEKRQLRHKLMHNMSFSELDAVDHLKFEREMAEENFWWPGFGEEEINRAKGMRGVRKG